MFRSGSLRHLQGLVLNGSTNFKVLFIIIIRFSGKLKIFWSKQNTNRPLMIYCKWTRDISWANCPLHLIIFIFHTDCRLHIQRMPASWVHWFGCGTQGKSSAHRRANRAFKPSSSALRVHPHVRRQQIGKYNARGEKGVSCLAWDDCRTRALGG